MCAEAGGVSVPTAAGAAMLIEVEAGDGLAVGAVAEEDVGAADVDAAALVGGGEAVTVRALRTRGGEDGTEAASVVDTAAAARAGDEMDEVADDAGKAVEVVAGADDSGEDGAVLLVAGAAAAAAAAAMMRL